MPAGTYTFTLYEISGTANGTFTVLNSFEVVVYDSDDNFGVGDDQPNTETGAAPVIQSLGPGAPSSWNVGDTFYFGGARGLDGVGGTEDIYIPKVAGAWQTTQAVMSLDGASTPLVVGQTYTRTSSGNTDGETLPNAGPDYIVEGTSGDDTIDAGYAGDPDGDQIDNNDHVDSSNSDSIEAGAGNDSIVAGADDDTISGGTGNDTIHGDFASEELLVNGSFEDGAHSANGVNGLTGWNNTSGSPDSADDGTSAEYWHPDNYASDGTGYVTMWASSSGPQEAMQQTLSTPLQAGTSYTMSVNAISASYASGQWFTPTNIPVLFEVIDASTGNVIGSTTVQGTEYDQYSFSFTPTANVSTIIVRPNTTGTGSNPSLIIDELSLIETPSGVSGSDSILAGGGDDVVYGEAGNDTVFGADGSDTIYGGDGDDELDGDDAFATGAADSIHGGAGNDQIIGDVGNDTLDGGLGNDTVYAGSEDDIALGGAGDDQLFGQDGDDTLSGGGGNDSIYGGTGNDEIIGGAGNDLLDGGDGMDNFDYTVIEGDDTVIGGEVNDTAAVNSGDKLDAHDSTENLTVVFSGDEAGTMTNGTSTVTFSEIEHILGGQGTDSIDASASNVQQILDGGEGSDTLQGGTGDDIIAMGQTQDFSTTDGDNDLLILEDGFGDDSIEGFEVPVSDGSGGFNGRDQLDVTGLTDVGGNPVDVDDVIVTDTNGDGTGDAILNFPNGESITLWGVSTSQVTSDDQLIAMGIPAAAASLDYIVEGTAAGELINTAYVGDPEGDMVDNNDHLDGTNSDSIEAGAGDDTVVAGLGNDSVLGEAGNDEIYGNAGDDSILGGAGADEIHGETGNDTIDGGTGVDTIYGGLGSDSLSGGDGADSLYAGDQNDTLAGDAGNDSLWGDSGNDTLDGGLDDDYLDGGTGDDSLLGDLGNDAIAAGAGDDTARGGMGNDLIYGEAGNDSLHGNEGDDTVYGGSGSDSIYGEEGHDYVSGGAGNDTVEGNEGNDTIFGGEGDDWIRGSFGNDSILSDAGDDVLWGGYGDDTFAFSDNFGNDTIEGEEAQETNGDTLDLSGVTQDLTVDLTSANPEAGSFSNGTGSTSFVEVENIILGGGDDTLVLGTGSGADTVQGFTIPTDLGGGAYSGNDLLDVSTLADTNGAPVNTDDVSVSDDGSGNALLTFPSGESLTLIGVTPASINDPAILEAMGIPRPDYVVEGTAAGELIDGTYLTDPDGDVIDGNDDASGGNTDSVQAGAGDDTVLSYAANDTIDGGAGNDSIDAGDGDDQVYGGTGNDTVQGWFGDDNIVGGAGDDSLVGWTGDDTILGGTGADTIEAGDGEDQIVLEDGFGNDQIDGGDGGATDYDTLNLSGVSSNTTVDLTSANPETGSVTSGADTASFTDIENVILGGGRDTIVLADGSGADTVEGFNTADSGDGTTIDQLDVSGMTDADGNPVTVADVTVTDDGGGNAVLSFPNGESITLSGVSPSAVDSHAELEAIGIPGLDYIVEGTGGADTIDGSYTGDPEGDMVDNGDMPGGSDADSIEGYGGNDSIVAGAGNDTVSGGTGDDTVLGGVGDDWVTGSAGNDTVSGGAGNDSVYGGAGNDSLTGDAGNDSMEGWLGDDTMLGGDGNDYIDGADGNDSIFGGLGNDTLLGGNGGGSDTLDGGAGNDSLSSGDGNETLIGGAGDDTQIGSGGDDTFVLANGFGSDTITGGETGETGGDTLDASDVTDDLTVDLSQGAVGDPESGTISDGAGTSGFSEIENITLGSGADSLTGSSGNDTVSMGAGADTVDGGVGDDSFDLGTDGDRDVVVLTDGGGADTVSSFDMTDSGDGTTIDQLDVSGLTDVGGNPVNVHDVTVTDTNGDGTGDAILTFPNGETITLTGVSPSAVDSNAGLEAIGIPGTDEIVSGTAAGDIINGAYTGDPDGDMVDAGDNSAGNNDDVIHAGAGNDIVLAGTGNDSVLGDAGNDSLIGEDGDDTLEGGAGDDTLFGGLGSDTVLGGIGDDSLVGNGGPDSLDGGVGDDDIRVSSGDTAQGGDGDDTFTIDGTLTDGTAINIVGGEGDETLGDTLDFGGQIGFGDVTYTNTDPGVGGGLSGFATLGDGTVVNFDEIENVIICFTAGTKIATPQGERNVEDLREGDLVVTRDNGLQPIRWVGKRTVPALGGLAPVRFDAGVLGNARALDVSPQHRMLLRGPEAALLFGEYEVLAPAKHLINGGSIRAAAGGDVTYVHIMFDQHEVIYAEGCASESFYPGGTGIDAVERAAREELFTLFPELRSHESGYGDTARMVLKAHEAKLIKIG